MCDWGPITNPSKNRCIENYSYNDLRVYLVNVCTKSQVGVVTKAGDKAEKKKDTKLYCSWVQRVLPLKGY